MPLPKRLANGTRFVAANDNIPAPGKRSTKTTTVGGKRVRIVATTSKAGVTTTKVESAPVLEWRHQAAIIRRLRQMIKSGITFAVAGDMNGLPIFSAQMKVKAKATGMTSGEHDVRVYMPGGRLGLIEVKGAEGVVSDEQEKRHALLASLGFTLQGTIFAKEEADAADQAEAIVRGWLAAA